MQPAQQLLLVNLFGSAPAAGEEKIKVGVPMSYSGPSGQAGQTADNVIKHLQQKNGTAVADRAIEFVGRDSTGPDGQLQNTEIERFKAVAPK